MQNACNNECNNAEGHLAQDWMQNACNNAEGHLAQDWTTVTGEK